MAALLAIKARAAALAVGTTAAVASLAVPGGRITVTDKKVVVTENGRRTSTDVEDPAAAFLERLGLHFRQSNASGVLRQL